MKEKIYLSGNKNNIEKFEYYSNYFKDQYMVINPLDYIDNDKKRLFKKLINELMDCQNIFIIDNGNDIEDDETITEINIAYNFDLKPLFESEIIQGN